MGALSPLELRLEISKRVANAHGKLLDLFSDELGGPGHVYGYRNFRCEIHIHFSFEGWMHCATFRAENRSEVTFPGPFLESHSVQTDGEAVACSRKLAVFIGVGNVSQDGRPIASIVRLQTLDICPMGGIYPGQITPYGVPESLLSVADRELGHLLGGPAIEPRQLKDQIIQSRAQVVANLAKQNSEDAVNDYGLSRGAEVVRRFIVIMNPESLVVEFSEGCLPSPEVLDVLYCPIDPVERVLEWMNDGQNTVPRG